MSTKELTVLMVEQGKHPSNPQRIVLDFSEVTYITSGLAKELFGGLYKEFGIAMKEIITIKVGANNETLKTTILRALSSVLTRK